MENTTYRRYSKALDDCAIPAAFVDMDLLDKNISSLIRRSKTTPVRIATKSVRSTKLVEYIAHKLKEQSKFAGLMCYHPKEAIQYSKLGFENILVAYPYMRASNFNGLMSEDLKNIHFMVDELKHLEVLDEKAQQLKANINVCIDIDVATDFKFVYFGVRRSSLKSFKQLDQLIDRIKQSKYLSLTSLMGYEAQIAGVIDYSPKAYLNSVINFLKKISMKNLMKRRVAIVERVEKKYGKLQFVNGGGTGSIEQTIKDPSISEIAIGSGFYQPKLFDYYKNTSEQPAVGFALEVSRRPSANYVTCAGGGMIASGSFGVEKQPYCYLPYEYKLDSNEGAGEVQTPVFIHEGKVELGELIFFRHAKSGELCEHFNELHLIRGDRVVDKAKTYRGSGEKFL